MRLAYYAEVLKIVYRLPELHKKNYPKVFPNLL
jgi:hypothetical protein